MISVADTGIGIAPEDQDKLFRIDVHPAKIGTAESSGSGLGLVICKEMIQRCKGEISIDSSLSPGTTVSFTLPVTMATRRFTEAGEIPQPDFMLLMKKDMNNLEKLPEPFVKLYNSSLLTEIRRGQIRSFPGPSFGFCTGCGKCRTDIQLHVICLHLAVILHAHPDTPD